MNTKLGTMVKKIEMFFKYYKVDILVILAVFVVGFFIRLVNLRYIIHVDELKWIERGPMFIDGLLSLQPSKTFFTYHPGVTTMYISGLVQLILPEHVDVITSVRIPFCVFGVATCSLIYLMGKSMFGRERGLIAAVMLTVEPFYIGITRIVHTDGLLSFFFTLTLYFFWLGISQQKQKYIVLSGISLGLAALTKTSAIFLIPILAAWILLTKNKTKLNSQQAMTLLLKIVLIGGLIFFILWPGIWNLYTSDRAYKLEYLIGKYEETFLGHKENPIFFLGTTEWENNYAPVYFYPLILIIRLSTGVMICFIISLVLYAHKLHKKESLLKDTLILLVIVIFIIGISMIGKKIGRYLIPIWPVLMLTSAGGFQVILNWANSFSTSISRLKNRQLILKMILGFTVVSPAALWSVSYQPFYVFYFNDFVGGFKGGSQITTSGSTAGSRLVAEYLSNKSNEFIVACAYSPDVLAYFYEGNVTGLPSSVTRLFEQYDYVVFHLTWVQRNPDNAIWQYFKDKNPEFTIIVQGRIVVWGFNVQMIDISP